MTEQTKEHAAVAATRSRRRTLAIASAAGVVALAVAAPIGWKLLPIGQPDEAGSAGVTGSPNIVQVSAKQQSRQPQQSPQVVRQSIDLAKLPKGSAPKVPWLSDGVIHDGAKKISLPKAMHNAVRLRPFGDGYVVAYSPDELTLKYARLDAQGKVKRQFAGLPVMDAQGNRVAYADEGVQGKTVLYLLDLRTGKTKQASTSSLPRHRPVGFASDPEGPGSERILLADRGGEGGDPLRTGMWNPANGKVEASRYATVSRVAGGVFVGSTSECSGVYDLHGQEFWKDCKRVTPGLTINGRYAFGSNGDRDNSRLLVRNAMTGKTAFDISGVYTEPGASVASESDGSVVFRAEDAATGAHAALVRCTTVGKCELASPLTEYDTPILAD